MATANKHTPTPWSFNKHGRHSQYFGNIVGGYGVNERGVEQIRTITCQLNYGTEEENQANAEFIVTAVNAYASSQAEIARLRKALEPFAEAADVFAREYPAMLEKPNTSCGIRFDALQAARAALESQP